MQARTEGSSSNAGGDSEPSQAEKSNQALDFALSLLQGMHKKSMEVSRKAESQEKLADGWRAEQEEEELKGTQASSQRGSDKLGPAKDSEDTAIDLSRTAKHEKRGVLRQYINGDPPTEQNDRDH